MMLKKEYICNWMRSSFNFQDFNVQLFSVSCYTRVDHLFNAFVNYARKILDGRLVDFQDLRLALNSLLSFSWLSLRKRIVLVLIVPRIIAEYFYTRRKCLRAEHCV